MEETSVEHASLESTALALNNFAPAGVSTQLPQDIVKFLSSNVDLGVTEPLCKWDGADLKRKNLRSMSVSLASLGTAPKQDLSPCKKRNMMNRLFGSASNKERSVSTGGIGSNRGSYSEKPRTRSTTDELSPKSADGPLGRQFVSYLKSNNNNSNNINNSSDTEEDTLRRRAIDRAGLSPDRRFDTARSLSSSTRKSNTEIGDLLYRSAPTKPLASGGNNWSGGGSSNGSGSGSGGSNGGTSPVAVTPQVKQKWRSSSSASSASDESGSSSEAVVPQLSHPRSSNTGAEKSSSSPPLVGKPPKPHHSKRSKSRQPAEAEAKSVSILALLKQIDTKDYSTVLTATKWSSQQNKLDADQVDMLRRIEKCFLVEIYSIML